MTEEAIRVADHDRAVKPESPGLGRDFWRLWTADGLSNLADGILKIALPLVALAYTRSPALIAGLAFAFTLPWLLFALPAGALVDRVDRRRAMLGANAVRTTALVALVETLLFDAGSIWVLYCVAFCVGSTETVYDTAAQSLVPRLVPRDRLPRANGRLFAVELTTNQFIGPPLAGLLVAVGATLALATPLALWVAALGAILLLRGNFRAGGGETAGGYTGGVGETGETAEMGEKVERIPSTLRSDIGEGLRFLWGNRLLRTLAAMTGAYNFATNATFAVFVLYATGPTSAVKLSNQGYGLLLATLAIGSVLGSFLAEGLTERLGRTRCLALSIPGGALLVGLPAVTRSPYVIGAGFLIGGAASIIWNVIAVSLRQRLTPDRLLGRVNSAYRLLAWGVMPLGAAAGGLLAQVVGLRVVFIAMAGVMLVMLLGLRVVTDRRMAEAEREADSAFA